MYIVRTYIGAVICVFSSGAQRVRLDSMDSEKQREFEDEGEMAFMNDPLTYYHHQLKQSKCKIYILTEIYGVDAVIASNF